MAHWIGAQGQLKWVKNTNKYLICDVTKRKPDPQIKKRFKSKLEDLLNP